MINMDMDSLIDSILGDGTSDPDIRYSELPGIDLYMDQVTTFLEDKLRSMVRDPETERFLTKTMINNYAKSDLIPPPVNKKYTREHLILLILIFYNKSFLSMDDIKRLLTPLRADRKEEDAVSPGDLYSYLLEITDSQKDQIRDQIKRYENAVSGDMPFDDEDGSIRRFMLLSLLSYDVFVKKLMIERLLDADEGSGEGKTKKSKADKRKKEHRT